MNENKDELRTKDNRKSSHSKQKKLKKKVKSKDISRAKSWDRKEPQSKVSKLQNRNLEEEVKMMDQQKQSGIFFKAYNWVTGSDKKKAKELEKKQKKEQEKRRMKKILEKKENDLINSYIENVFGKALMTLKTYEEKLIIFLKKYKMKKITREYLRNRQGVPDILVPEHKPPIFPKNEVKLVEDKVAEISRELVSWYFERMENFEIDEKSLLTDQILELFKEKKSAKVKEMLQQLF